MVHSELLSFFFRCVNTAVLAGVLWLLLRSQVVTGLYAAYQSEKRHKKDRQDSLHILQESLVTEKKQYVDDREYQKLLQDRLSQWMSRLLHLQEERQRARGIACERIENRRRIIEQAQQQYGLAVQVLGPVTEQLKIDLQKKAQVHGSQELDNLIARMTQEIHEA